MTTPGACKAGKQAARTHFVKPRQPTVIARSAPHPNPSPGGGRAFTSMDRMDRIFRYVGRGFALTPGPSPGGGGETHTPSFPLSARESTCPWPPGYAPPPAHGEPVEPRGNLDEVAMVVGWPGKPRFNPRPRVCAVTQSPPPSVPAPANHPSRRRRRPASPRRCIRSRR